MLRRVNSITVTAKAGVITEWKARLKGCRHILRGETQDYPELDQEMNCPQCDERGRDGEDAGAARQKEAE